MIVPGSARVPAVSLVQIVRNQHVPTIAPNVVSAVMVCAFVPLVLLETVAKSDRFVDLVANASGRSMATVTTTKWNAYAKKATRASTVCTKLTMGAVELHCWKLAINLNK